LLLTFAAPPWNLTMAGPGPGVSGRGESETTQVVEVGHRERDRRAHPRVGGSGVTAGGNEPLSMRMKKFRKNESPCLIDKRGKTFTAVCWLWIVDGVRPTRWDLLGSCVALLGMAIIMFAPRQT